ncbi:DEAD/DEAH box helicase [Shewanella colwelliana]|uniref:DEAD/DEAH box helicase n=1 Tax=Shewanella colwelliana TaxID=23 RepID=A0A1E5IQ47_SHECO|nr:DEAD/DEAH box helicase [Shewanella colwelliana]OEG72681.1 DEAD/DEAH box helicase [Shewanella colwelliana]
MTFANLKLTAAIIDNLPHELTTPTPIQQLAVPVILAGRDLIALAQTGSGKTYAFGLPLLQNIDVSAGYVQGVVIVPTRELAQQVATALQPVALGLGIKVSVLCGGIDIEAQRAELVTCPQLVVATPGRLLALLQQQALQLEGLKQLVLDEADRLMEMGFWPDVERMMTYMPARRQTLLFSATMAANLTVQTDKLLFQPQHIKVLPERAAANDVTERVYLINKGDKARALIALLNQSSWPQVLVFVNGRDDTDKLLKKLLKAGIDATALHGDKNQQAREQALADFKAQRVRVLVTTDLLSRGIHVEALPVVINLDLPTSAPVYVHRIGRTARAGESGLAISLICHSEQSYLEAIAALTQRVLVPEPLAGFMVTDKPASETATRKRAPRDKQANRRSLNKQSARDFVKKADKR